MAERTRRCVRSCNDSLLLTTIAEIRSSIKYLIGPKTLFSLSAESVKIMAKPAHFRKDIVSLAGENDQKLLFCGKKRLVRRAGNKRGLE